MDFTLRQYDQFLIALKQSGLGFTLRHDVDLMPLNSLRVAEIEAQQGLSSIFYFRMVPESYDAVIIKQIASLGHAIGYHYESLTTTHGDIDEAYRDFTCNLAQLRLLYPVTSICMHGSPRSPWDSKDIWRKYSYRELGIDYEPYFDTDFSRTLYLTDTGRRWDGYHVSVRDKIPQYQEQWEAQGLSFRHTSDIIAQLCNPDSPLRKSSLDLLITTHPQRWNSLGFSYLKEFVLQTAKNSVKRFLIKRG